MSSAKPEQLSLGVQLRADATFENFIPGDNGLALQALRAIASQASDEPSIVIHGLLGSGCTYLLQACCHAAESKQLSAIYLPLTEVRDFSTEVLEGLEHYNLVCIDQLESIAGRLAWEEALFHLFNRLRESGARLVIAAADRPDALDITLPDLRSRLNWGLVLQIRALDDEQKLEALVLRAKSLGLTLPNEVAQYLLKYSERDLDTLYSQLDRLDRASLREQRRITIPFVKQVLGWT